MEELYEGNRQEIITILELIIGIIFAPKYPSLNREMILKNNKEKLNSKDEESIRNIIEEIIDRYDLDYKEKSFNISTTSTSIGSSSPFLSSRKSFSNQITIFEDKNRELIEEIENLNEKIKEDIDSKKRLEEIVKSLKSSNKNIEKKNEELKKKYKIIEKENKNFEERNKELENTIENLLKNNSKTKKEYEIFLIEKERIEKEKREFEKKYNHLKEKVNDENKNSNSKIEQLIKLNQSLNEESKKIKFSEFNQLNDFKIENENLKKQLLLQQNVFFKELKDAKDLSNLEFKLISSTFYKNGISIFRNRSSSSSSSKMNLN